MKKQTISLEHLYGDGDMVKYSFFDDDEIMYSMEMAKIKNNQPAIDRDVPASLQRRVRKAAPVSEKFWVKDSKDRDKSDVKVLAVHHLLSSVGENLDFYYGFIRDVSAEKYSLDPKFVFRSFLVLVESDLLGVKSLVADHDDHDFESIYRLVNSAAFEQVLDNFEDVVRIPLYRRTFGNLVEAKTSNIVEHCLGIYEQELNGHGGTIYTGPRSKR